MKFLKVAEFFETLERTSSRLELRDHLSGFYKEVEPVDGAIVSYFIIGRLAPKFVASEFNISKKTVEKVLLDLFSLDSKTLKEYLVKYSDHGGAFYALKSEFHEELKKNTSKNTVSQGFTVFDIYEKLWDIAKLQGSGSSLAKYEKLRELLLNVSPVEGKYIIRIVLGRTRLGVNERSIIDALAYVGDSKGSVKPLIEQAFGYTSDIGYVTYLYLKGGVKLLEKKAVFVPGIPIAPKLVERESSIYKIFERIPKPYLEPKYDGLRCQVHIFRRETEIKEHIKDRIWARFVDFTVREQLKISLEDVNFIVKLYSRNLEDMTYMFPEIVEGFLSVAENLFKKYSDSEAYVFDGEIVGFNENTNEFIPFQETMTRKRKYNIKEAAKETPVKIFTFDVLFWKKEPILNLKLEERKEFLSDIKNLNQDVLITPTHTPSDVKEATDLFYEYITEGLEGVIFKDPKSLYTPGLRNFDWIKFKKAMKHELADTIDVVVLGYYYGTGRLAKLGIGALLAGIYDKENDRFLTITKIGTGITDDLWKEIKKRADQYRVDRKLPNVVIPKELMPDVLLEPGLVIEVEADEITKSPLHSAGYALRFPRFKRFRDKSPYDVTTLQEILEMVGKNKKGE